MKQQARAFLIAGAATLLYATTAYASTNKTVEFFVSYDYMSILYGIGVSVGASLCRTAYMLAIENVIIINSKVEVFKDIVVAAVGGLIATILIRAGLGLPALESLLTVDVCVLLLFWAGWSRNSFFVWIGSLSQRLAVALQDRVVKQVEDK